MAHGYVCDRCGAAIFDADHTGMKVEMKGLQTAATAGTLDLCPKCAQAVFDIITRRVITANTVRAAWILGDTDE